jgi:hypothetical protein
MHKRSTPEEYVELAEICLFEADLTLDREGAERLRITARRYLREAERMLKEKWPAKTSPAAVGRRAARISGCRRRFHYGTGRCLVALPDTKAAVQRRHGHVIY